MLKKLLLRNCTHLKKKSLNKNFDFVLCWYVLKSLNTQLTSFNYVVLLTSR